MAKISRYGTWVTRQDERCLFQVSTDTKRAHPTAVFLFFLGIVFSLIILPGCQVSPTPSPTPVPTVMTIEPTPVPTLTPTPLPTLTPAPTVVVTATPTPSPTPTPKPSLTPTLPPKPVSLLSSDNEYAVLYNTAKGWGIDFNLQYEEKSRIALANKQSGFWIGSPPGGGSAASTMLYFDQVGNQWKLRPVSSPSPVSTGTSLPQPTATPRPAATIIPTPTWTTSPKTTQYTLPINSKTGKYGNHFLGLVKAPDGVVSNSYDKFVTLINNVDARNPTYAQLIAFLNADNTDKFPYQLVLPLSSVYYGDAEDKVDLKYVTNVIDEVIPPDQPRICSDYAEMLHNNAEKAGIRCGYIGIDFLGQSEGHALNVFETTDMGLIYIDDTGPSGAVHPLSADKKVNLELGKPYVPVSLFPEEGWSPNYESIGIVSSIYMTWDGNWR